MLRQATDGDSASGTVQHHMMHAVMAPTAVVRWHLTASANTVPFPANPWWAVRHASVPYTVTRLSFAAAAAAITCCYTDLSGRTKQGPC
jgi:hypothetical protein